MRPSNIASRNVWASLSIIGIASFVVGVQSIVMNPNEVKSWCYFFIGVAIAGSFLKKFLYYQKLVNRGIEYGSE